MNVPASTLQPLKPGDTLGAYTVQERIAAGGSSMVYRAVDALLNKQVAIKQLMPQVDDAAFRHRFRQEAALHRKVSETHPGLVQLIDTIEEPRGVFLIMDYVQGQTLEQILLRTGNPIDATQTLRLVWSIAQALQAIHQAGVLHRDLKPSNILVVDPKASAPGNGATPGNTTQANRSPIQIADMGVATLMAEQEAMSLGSVRYMSPELLNGEAADARADIYSLGLIFYEMLIGRSAFQDVFKAVLKDERNQAVRWMKWHTNPRAQAPRVDAVNARLPENLGQLVAHAMAKDINDRYPSAQALAETIQRHFTTQGAATRIDEQAQIQQLNQATAQTAGDTARLPDQKKKPRALWWFAGSAVATAGVVAGALIMQQGPSPEAQARQNQAMAAGDSAFQAGQWPQAMAAYEQVITTPEPDRLDDLMPRAQDGLWTAQAKQALIDNDIDAAATALSKLRQSPTADTDWVDAISSELSRKRVLTRAERDIADALDANRLGDARDALDALYRQGITFTEQEQQQINALGARQAAMETQVKLDHDLAEVDRLVARGQEAEAMQRLRRMEARYAETVVADRITDLLKDQRYEQGLADGQARLDAGDLPGAIRYWATALENRPNDEALTERLTQLRIREAVNRGNAYRQDGRPEMARDAFAEALTHGESAQAMQALGQLDAQDQQAALVQQGDQAMARGAFDQAVNAYDAAASLNTTQSDRLGVNTKLDQARVADLTHRANQALAAGDLPQAGRLFEEALSINPNHAAARQGADEVSRGAAYERHRQEGDAALRVQRFGQALKAYRAARDQINTEQIRRLIDDAEFAQLIALARGSMTSKDFASAKAYLLTARQNRTSPVIDELMAAVEMKAAEAAP